MLFLSASWNPIQYVADNWQTESYPKFSDLSCIFLFTAFFPIIRFFLDNLIFEPVGRHYIFRNARALALKSRSKAAVPASSGPAASEKTPLLSSPASAKSVANGDCSAAGTGTADSLGDKAKAGLHLANGTGTSGKGPMTSGDAGSGAAVASVEEIDKEALEKTLVKFKESCWKSLYYTSAVAFAAWVSADEPWLGDCRNYFRGPGDLRWPDQTMKLKLKALFMYEGGFYSYSIFALLFWETRRKDFVVSMVHHVASVFLALSAFIFRFGRVASLVVAIHDTSDIFLELAKVNRYLNYEVTASVMFLLFAGSWAVLRLYCYPRYVIYASAFAIFEVLDKEEHTHDGPPLYYFFNFILILLLVLHVYWWILIARVLIKQITTQFVLEKDCRSEDEDDD